MNNKDLKLKKIFFSAIENQLKGNFEIELPSPMIEFVFLNIFLLRLVKFKIFIL